MHPHLKPINIIPNNKMVVDFKMFKQFFHNKDIYKMRITNSKSLSCRSYRAVKANLIKEIGK